MNRIDRLTAIIIYLQGRRYTSVDQLAEKYSISTRTVYRDLNALQEAGVPLGFEPGMGYYIVKGYHLPPVMFSREEASSLLAAERLMQKWHDTGLGKAYVSALEKIRAILPPDDKEYFETLDRHVQVFRFGDEKNEPKPDEKIFSFLQNAVFKTEVIAIEYSSPHRTETTRRKVEPLGILLMANQWYLAGWCRLRNDYRMFRLDRFKEYRFSGEKLSNPPKHTLREFYDRNLHEEKELVEVMVRFEDTMVRYIGDQKYWHGWAWEKKVNGGLEMTFLCSHTEYLCRWLMMWGDTASVIKPELVKNRVSELACELYEHYKK